MPATLTTLGLLKKRSFEIKVMVSLFFVHNLINKMNVELTLDMVLKLYTILQKV